MWRGRARSLTSGSRRRLRPAGATTNTPTNLYTGPARPASGTGMSSSWRSQSWGRRQRRSSPAGRNCRTCLATIKTATSRLRSYASSAPESVPTKARTASPTGYCSALNDSGCNSCTMSSPTPSRARLRPPCSRSRSPRTDASARAVVLTGRAGHVFGRNNGQNRNCHRSRSSTRMAPTPSAPPDDDFTERILDIDVSSEMQTSFLEYAYSVIYSRALPDARDGLKPVQRRILYSMDEMGVRPDRTHVKCARVVGEVMGKYHPHGDGAIYDALVRTAQPWTMRLALIDGHGNFGSPDDGPAAMRYTECRMAAAALAMTAGLDQDTVDFKPNYDGKDVEPVVLPAAFPNLLVNGASGIAVGMATNCPPHNLVEVVQALRHLISHPDAGVEELMRFIPGPDLPTGGKIIGLDGIRDAYTGGRGSFRIRATARIEQVHPRRKGIVITELPYLVGPERVIEQIKAGVNARRLQGIADVKDLSDRTNGTRLVIEVKNGFNPEALLEQLYKVTKMEDTFGINAVALVDGQPRTLNLPDLLTVYLEHRYEVTRRRTAFARSRATDRLHLVEGLLVAILHIDDVIAIIRSSDDVAQARE